jgi:hypothetical protein
MFARSDNQPRFAGHEGAPASSPSTPDPLIGPIRSSLAPAEGLRTAELGGMVWGPQKRRSTLTRATIYLTDHGGKAILGS